MLWGSVELNEHCWLFKKLSWGGTLNMLGVGVVIGVGVGVGAGTSQRLQGSEIDRRLKQNLGYHMKLSILLCVYWYYHQKVVVSFEVLIKSSHFTMRLWRSCYEKHVFFHRGNAAEPGATPAAGSSILSYRSQNPIMLYACLGNIYFSTPQRARSQQKLLLFF